MYVTPDLRYYCEGNGSVGGGDSKLCGEIGEEDILPPRPMV